MSRNNKNGKQNCGANSKDNKRSSRNSRSASQTKRNLGCTLEDSDSRYNTKGSNDPSWYATDPSLLRDAANVAFSYPTGRPLNLENTFLPGYKRLMPGVLTLEVIPTVGWSEDPNSPINMAAMSQYTFVRKNKAGDLPFDAPDLMCYSLAMADLYSYINYLQRLYGLASLYTQQNEYIPRALVEANHANFDDIITNLADFRYGINVLINKAASIAAPANLTLYQRRAFLYQNLYTEGSSIKDQLYMYVPQGFLTFNTGEDVSSGTRLSYKSFATKDRNVSELLAYGNELITNVVNSADAQTMSAFIYEAFGDGGILKLQSMPETYAVTPIYDIGVLEQFKNATVVPVAAQNGGTLASIQIRQDATKGFLISRPQAMIQNTDPCPADVLRGLESSKILTTSSYDVNASLVMESSRLALGAEDYAAPSGSSTLHTINLITGSEIAFKMKVWTYTAGGTLVSSDFGYSIVFDGTTASKHLSSVTLLSMFKFHPEVNYYYKSNSEVDKVTAIYSVSDVDNFTILTRQDVRRLHEAALLNELNVPKIGKLS